MKFWGGEKLGSGRARSAKQLAFLIDRLQGTPKTADLIVSQLEFTGDADAAVQRIPDFQRLWAMYHFPQILRAIDRIQREVFRKLRLPLGSYELFASRVESLFSDSSTIALDEYGVPLEVARKLESVLNAAGSLGTALTRLSSLNPDELGFDEFEREMVSHAAQGLAPSDRVISSA